MRLHGIAICCGCIGIGGACAILFPQQPQSMLLSVFLCTVWLATMDVMLRGHGK